jgi:hypothetical protein
MAARNPSCGAKRVRAIGAISVSVVLPNDEETTRLALVRLCASVILRNAASDASGDPQLRPATTLQDRAEEQVSSSPEPWS